MRIALLQPTFWPEVRRGTERLVRDLGVSLTRRGHEVDLITSRVGPRSVSTEDGIRVVRTRRLPERTPLNWYEHHVSTIPATAVELIRNDYDIAHAFFGPQAWAGVQAKKAGGPPVVYSIHGILSRRYLVRRRYRLELIEAAVNGADGVNVLSEAAAESFRGLFGIEPAILPGGVFTREFEGEAERSQRPTVLCAASLGDPRKRAPLLFEAFRLARIVVPDARLQLVSTPDPVMSSAVGPLPEGAEWVNGDETPRLASLYAGAWASVLPAVEEAFGLVILESLAAGTPVVAARSGACPEIISGNRVGRLFTPDDSSELADALVAALTEPPSNQAVARCRDAAAKWDWAKIVERYGEEYCRALET